MHRRPFVSALVGGVLLATATVGIALAAVQRATLSHEAAPPGTQVTLRVDTTARWAGSAAAPAFLVPEPMLEQAGDSVRCEAIPGATVLGEMTWRAEAVEFSGFSHPGFVGDAEFTVPDVPEGRYYIGESTNARGAGCHLYASFTVISTSIPDTAMRDTSTSLHLVALLAAMFAAIVVSAAHRAMRLR